MKRLALVVVTVALLTGCGPDKSDPQDTRDPLQKCLEDNNGIGCDTAKKKPKTSRIGQAGQFCSVEGSRARTTYAKKDNLTCVDRYGQLRWRRD